MNWLVPSIIATLTGTVILTFCFYYLYVQDPQKYLKIWTVGWGVYITRYVFMLLFLLWRESPFLMIGNQLTTLVSGFLLLYGSHLFIEKKFPRVFFYILIAGTVWIFISVLEKYPFFMMALPTFSFLAAIYIWTGYIFYRQSKSKRSETAILGITFMAWGVHVADYPFLRPLTELVAPWGYLVAAGLELITALGLLIVYFRKTKDELRETITERNKTNRELKKQKRLFETMFNAIPDAVIITNAQREIKLANKSVASIFGYTFEELKGKSTAMLYTTKKDFEQIGETLFNREISPDQKHLYLTTYRKKDGTVFSGEAFGAKLLDDENQRIGNLGIIRDITERLETEKRLQQAQKMESIGNLAGGIAHDFNNILSPIVGLSELLLEDLPQDSPARESVAEIFKAGNRGSDLVGQILALSRQSRHRLAPVLVQKILKEALKLSRATIPANIKIVENIARDCGPIMADPTQIHQVAMNIITNAYHAVESDGGEIAIALTEKTIKKNGAPTFSLKPGRYVTFSVSDTGHGISADTLPQIFEPYFTTKAKGKGTGLGLAVAYGIVKAHKGEIRVHSQAGRGSVFSIYLPLLKKQAPDTVTDKIPEIPRGNQERILLVDDEKPIEQLVKTILERTGYQVTSYLNSLEALEAFKSAPQDFDLVLSDMNMPHMTGAQLAGEIKTIRADIPVIICTGFSEQLNRENARAKGIDGLLMKPVIRSDMATMIRKTLDRRRPKKYRETPVNDKNYVPEG